GPFAEYISTQPEGTALIYHFWGWATEGNAVEMCGGNYALYVRVFIFATALYQHEIQRLGGPENGTRLMHSPHEGDTLLVVSEDEWKVMVYRTMRGLPPVDQTIPAYE